MFGILLASIGTLFEEAGSSLGKKKTLAGEQSVYTMGFLQMFGLIVAFGLLWAFTRQAFVFSLASLSTFLPRIALEIIQAHVTMIAITRADRSTYGFVRVITIPLLLAADIFLGYPIQTTQILGLCLMVTALLIVFTNHGIQKKAIGYVLFSAINASITISLYKYDITHFNSVVAEQLIVCALIAVYFWVMALAVAKENAWRFLTRPLFLAQAVTQGIGGTIASFAYLFAPASVILASVRSSSVLWSILSGSVYFKEQYILIKILAFLLLIGGIVLLVI